MIINPLRQVLSIPVWLFWRLPRAFSVSLVALTTVWIASFRLIEAWSRTHIGPFETGHHPFLAGSAYTILMLTVFGVGLLVVYNLSALVNAALLSLKPTGF